MASAPGRVNLIGEHTDYNGGFVLPAALSVGLSVELRPRADDRVVVCAPQITAQPGSRDLAEDAIGHWTDMSVGALREARSLGLIGHGADINVRSSIPAGAGLSSSAALCVAILKAARRAAGSALSNTEIALAARRAENDYLHIPCGIMDQMAVAHLQSGEAMALDTATLAFTKLALPPGHDFVVIHSGITRLLSEGRYALRKQECDAAAETLETGALCGLDPDAIEASAIDETSRRRARHCASEHRRVLAAADALGSGDVAAFGRLMNESHASMRDDFEMSLPAIDALVADAVQLGALGARLTGGGFGGCIVACVERERRVAWQADLLARHTPAWFVDAIKP